MSPLLVVFVDGVGLGVDDPLVNPAATARLSCLRALLGGRRPLLDGAPCSGAEATLVGLDACLGEPGLPQSGTGQAALLTGENAPRLFGRHFGPWTPTALRGLVEERSFLARAKASGRRVAFANAYPEELLAGRDPGAGGEGPDLVEAPPRARSRRAPMPLRIGPVIAARAAGLLYRHTAHLARGEAVASEIVNDGWRDRLGRRDVPPIGPEEAGRNLATIASVYDLTFYAHYTTDIVGHRGTLDEASAALERVDRFLSGILDGLGGGGTLLVVSDHGNIEDVRCGHTRNPALGLAVGPGHEELGSVSSILDVAALVLERLGVA